MPSNEIHRLGIELERVNSYIKPEFPADGNNSADYYDYGGNLLLGITLGTSKLRKRLSELSVVNKGEGTPYVNLEIALESAYEAMTELQNAPDFDVHKRTKEMAIAVQLLYSLAAFHAIASNRESFG